MDKFLILIPAYQPDQALIKLTQELSCYADILVVNDGSSGESLSILEEINHNTATVIGYQPNRGKGYALKHGIKWAVEHHYTHIVTADADGQHTVKDIANILNQLKSHKNDLILGTRDKSKMPPRSKLGNVLTCWLFNVLCNLSITDTQTGLRGICLTPEISDKLLSLSGDRYEYETNMLIEANRIFEQIIEIPIDTVYQPKNSSSHFRPIQDGLKIYKLLFQKLPLFTLASFASFLVDYCLFNFSHYISHAPVVIATVFARIFSGIFNFYLNKQFVFKTSGSYYSLTRYAFLVVCILIANCISIWILTEYLLIQPWIAKIIVEITLYFVNFMIQSNLTKKDG